MTLGEFLHSLIKKSGGNPDDDAVKNFLLNGELIKIEIPEDIMKTIDQNLISLTDAKNNHPLIKPHYTQLALSTMDKQIEKLLEELEMDDNIKAEVLSETSTYKRVPTMVRKIRELEAAKSASGKDDKATIQKQIDELHAQIRAEKQRADDAKTNFEKELVSFKIGNKKMGLFSAYKTIYDDLDPEIKSTTLQNILDKQLQGDNAELKFDENGNLVLLKKDGTNFYGDNNQQVNPQQYADMVLSRNKLLKTAPSAALPQTGGQTGSTGQLPTSGSGENKTNHALKELAAEALKSYQNGANFGVPAA